MKVITMNNTITAAKGFLACGVASGVKKSGKLDLGLISCPTGAKAAAMFTTNAVFAAPVGVCRKHIVGKIIYGAIVNSGNANACTGIKGFNDAVRMCERTAGHFGCDPHNILIASTGIIGEPLPMEKVAGGIDKAAGKLSATAAAGKRFAEAIMTTDTRPKQAVKQIKLGGKTVTVGGTAKGAGMIGPNMATTISVVTTDAAISKGQLSKALKNAIGQSLNRLTVDGHQSTNDTAMILASGLAGNKPINKAGTDYDKFAKALESVCSDLAKQMALDAEGATRMFRVEIKNAATKADAAKAARAVADYDLVKCAVHGADPNWGRIVCAVGSCGVKLNPEKLSCRIGNITVFRNGKPVKFDAKKVSRIIAQKEHTITVDLASGKASDFCYGCDLGREYITINADYHT